MQLLPLLLFFPALYYLWFFLSYNAAGSALLAIVVIIAAMIPLFLAKREKPKPLWFKAHTYGYGWTPATWQGWLLLAIMLFLSVFVGFLVSDHAGTINQIIIDAFPFWFLIITTFFAIVHRTGDKAHWHWGKHTHVSSSN